jgi:hypothetical protein
MNESLPIQLLINDPIIGDIDPNILLQLMIWKNPEMTALMINRLVEWGLENNYITIEEDRIKLLEKKNE